MAIELVPLCTMRLTAKPPVEVGAGPAGTRMVLDETSVQVHGDRLRGQLEGAANPHSREAGRARLQCACGGADQGKNPRLQRVFLNSTGRRPQAESGQRGRRDGYDLRILAGLRWFSMLGQLRSTGARQATARHLPRSRNRGRLQQAPDETNYRTGNRG